MAPPTISLLSEELQVKCGLTDPHFTKRFTITYLLIIIHLLIAKCVKFLPTVLNCNKLEYPKAFSADHCYIVLWNLFVFTQLQ